MLRNSKTVDYAKGLIVAAFLLSLFTLPADYAAAQKKPNDDDSIKYPRNWHNDDWVKFISSTVQIAAGEVYGAAGSLAKNPVTGARVNPGLGGKIPLLEIYSAISAMADSTKAGLQVWLRRKMADAATAEDWKQSDRYEAFYDCLTNEDCVEMKELIKSAAAQTNEAKSVILTIEVRDADTNKGIDGADVSVRSKTHAYNALTNGDGATDSLELPRESAGQGLQVRVKANKYEEKWSDITSDMLTGGDRRFTVHLRPTNSFAGTWLFRGIAGQLCLIERVSENRFKAVTEKGVVGYGYLQNSTTIVIDFPFARGLSGSLSADGNRITWTNGESWTRTH